MATADDINDVFGTMDPQKTGKLMGEDICFALRALEKNPTGKQEKAIEEKYKSGITLADFQKLYKSSESGQHPVEQDKGMREVLEVLDKDGAGFINVIELRQILANLGDSLDDKTLEQIFKEIKVDIDGNVAYDDLVDMLVNDYPLHFTGKVSFA